MKQKWQKVDMMCVRYLGVYYTVFSTVMYVLIFP